MKKVLSSLILAGSLTLTGCFGSFALTNTLKDVADGIDNVIVKEIVYIIGIAPVLGLGTIFGDFIILNTIEYWTGSNPLAYNETDANGNTVTAVKMDDGSLFMRVEAPTGESQELVLQKDEETLRILDAKGNVLKETALVE